MTGTPNPSSTGSSSPVRAQTKISVSDPKIMVNLLGAKDEILRLVERTLSSDVHVRGNEITITGDPADNATAERLFSELIELIEKGETLSVDAVRRTLLMLEENTSERPADVLTLNILSRRGRTIRPKTLGQKRYVDAIDENTIVFGIGPAGTGKTYLAMAKAVQALQAKQINRIILTRPAVEAGERLGFLPGTLTEKIDPYLRPLYDALHDMLDPESIPRLMAAGTIEVAPLAYMRGRAQPLDAGVLTPDGWRPIGELTVGDLVVGSNGRPTPVLGVYPQGRKPVYRVTTQDGASTLACGEHLWTVQTPDDRSHGRGARVVQTQDMIGRLRRGHVHRFELPLVEPVEFPEQDVPVDPYALGLLLGDGSLTTTTTPAFRTADPEPAGAPEAALPDVELVRKDEADYVPRHVDGRRGGVIVADPMTTALRVLGLAGTRSPTRFVPDAYLWNTAATRLAVLQGLLDSDGGPVPQRGRTCRIQYTTCSERLRDDVVFLVRSLGGVAHWRRRPAEGRKPGLANGRPVPYRNDAFVLDIRLPEAVQPFRLARKQELYAQSGGGRPMRFIESIEPEGETETVCIQVAAEDSLYVTDDLIVTHNTLNDAFIILDEAQNTTPEQMKMFLTRLGFGAKIVVTGDVTQVDLPGGTTSGLKVVREILRDVEDVHFAELSSSDVVRHRLVAEIVDAYARYDAVQDQQADNSVHAVPGRAATGRPGRRR
ncbi:phosphate starvation-inducible PhoH-like protein [Actinoplanes teichomyceticus]|uniref:PhoH-like protein n=1 Tax=Actinoplanes teichomyceticus TaxID=1867 RepID=A0A561WI81_ACTTI|nr:phosphate starvation-inducible PhoH-like protein [Actinoplanes teichomyceticus]